MKRFFQYIRYSSIGVFCAGIIGIIQGCSVEREGALLAALLLMLNFCSGPIASDPVPFVLGSPPIDGDVLLPIDLGQGFTWLCFDGEHPATVAGTITKWQIYLDAPTQLQLKLLRLKGSTVRVVAESALVNGVAGLNTFNTNIPGVEVGDFVGVWVGTVETVEASSSVPNILACSSNGNVAPGNDIPAVYIITPGGALSLQVKGISN